MPFYIWHMSYAMSHYDFYLMMGQSINYDIYKSSFFFNVLHFLEDWPTGKEGCAKKLHPLGYQERKYKRYSMFIMNCLKR